MAFSPPRKIKVVLVTPGNDFLERVVQTSVNVGTADGTIIAPAFYNPDIAADLFILDGFLPPPDKLPKVDTVFIRPTGIKAANTNGEADVAGFKVVGEIDNPAIMRWKPAKSR